MLQQMWAAQRKWILMVKMMKIRRSVEVVLLNVQQDGPAQQNQVQCKTMPMQETIFNKITLQIAILNQAPCFAESAPLSVWMSMEQ